MAMEDGEIGILNVGAGDTKLSFDPANPAERARAAKIVTDMLRRGFAILIEVGSDEKGPLYRRVTEFDPEKCEYIIAGDPGADEAVAIPEGARTGLNDGPPLPKEKGKRGRLKVRVPADKAKAISVSRPAGG